MHHHFFKVLLILLTIATIESCVSFLCINSCGSSKLNKGYKLIFAINRDEDIYRKTIPASSWPASTSLKLKSGLKCDQSNLQPPYNLCVYGALDVAKSTPPEHYSTWLGKTLKTK
jgi:hypothetical protein